MHPLFSHQTIKLIIEKQRIKTENSQTIKPIFENQNTKGKM
jgi:hypothetical protein